MPGGTLAVPVSEDEHDVSFRIGEDLLGKQNKLHFAETVKEKLPHRRRVVHREKFGREH